MYTEQNVLKELQEILVGQKVSNVYFCDDDCEVATFQLTNGYIFKIHNSIGPWLVKVKDIKNKIFRDNDFILKLKELLIGKTILDITEGYGEGRIATFHLDDGISFRLNSSLKPWVEETVPKGKHHISFLTLFRDWKIFCGKVPNITIEDGILTLQYKDFKLTLDINNSSEWEKHICNHSSGLQYQYIIDCSIWWQDYLSSSFGPKIPEELELDFN